jgi:hypothetical protein
MKMLRVAKKWVRVDFIFGMVGWWCGFGGVRGGLGGLWICMYVRSERRVGRETDGWVVWYSGNDNDLEFFFSSFLQWAGLGMLGF